MKRPLLVLVLLAGAVAACSSNASDPEPASPVPPVAPEDAGPIAVGPATIRFIVKDAAGEHEVSEIIYGDQVSVRVSGLRPGSSPVLRGVAHSSAPGRAFVSSAVFAPGATGTIDTGTMAPKKGDWDAVDVDGPMWSMKDVPAPPDLGRDLYAVSFSVTVDGVVAGKKSLARTAAGKGVVCRTLDGTDNPDNIVGTYCIPAPGASKRTPVLTFGGSEGGTFAGEYGAMIYATWGIPALGVGYFGAPGLPKYLERIPLEYFARAMEWLDRQPDVTPGKTVVSGGSRGGELALLLGATYPRVSGVVADVPSGYVWGATSGKPVSGWTLGGVDVPKVPSANASPEVIAGPDGEPGYRSTPVFSKSLASASPAQQEEASIKVEKIGGPVLMLAGENDDLWPSCEFSKRAMARLTQAGHGAAHPDEMKCYPAAGHALSFVGGPTTDAMWNYFEGEGWYSLGGTAKGIAAAQRDAQRRRHAFLDKVTR